MKLYCRLLTSITLCYALVGCTTKPETTSAVESDSQSVTMPDTITSIKKETPIHVPEGSLLIHGKDIWVRDYPNTGKVVMTLNEGDSCTYYEVGRYDVIRGVGSNWYRIAFNDKTGWVFGSQTNMKTEDPKNGDPFIENLSLVDEFDMNSFSSADCNTWIETTFDQLEKNYQRASNTDDESEIKIKKMRDSLLIERRTTIGYRNSMLKKGPGNTVIKSLNYSTEHGQASIFKWNSSILFSNYNGSCNVLTELNGVVIDILPLNGGKYLIIGTFELSDLGIQLNTGHTWIGVYNPADNSFLDVQKLGYYVYPVSFSELNEPYLATPVLTNQNDIIKLQLNEVYKTFEYNGKILSMSKINRFFQFNEVKNMFVETQQEEVLNLYN
jgi:hypothetical protein